MTSLIFNCEHSLIFPNILNAKTTVIIFHTSLVMLLALLYHKLALENAYPELALLVKIKGYTFRGNNSTVFIFDSPSQLGSTIKAKNLLLKEQILFFKSRSYFGIVWI